MSNKTILADDVFQEWHKDPEYMREYEALEDEFTLASELIGARICPRPGHCNGMPMPLAHGSGSRWNRTAPEDDRK